MKSQTLSQKLFVLSVVIAAVFALGSVGHSARPMPPPASEPLTVQAQASQGFALAGNPNAANILVVVTDAAGNPVNNLVLADFGVINHFSLPGQVCGFSNNITSFVNAGTGAYRLRVAPQGCNWVLGDYLAQIRIASGTRNGQTAVTLSIK
ncbi:MAG TPA: hypothetical protein VFZ34_33370 [Blastocatellia bacterium]|nr:hypothetical protein [Blastocatellia bacterium]